MVVEWALREAERAKEIVFVDVTEVKLTDSKDNIIETLPAVDVTTEEFIRWQRDPFVLQQSGDFADYMSAKSQTFSLVITIARLKKGNPSLDLEAPWIQSNWPTSKALKLIAAVSKAFGETEKNLENSESPMQDNSS